MRLWLGTIVLLVVSTMAAFSQSAVNYTATRTTGITYTPISSGSTFTWRNGSSTDENRGDLTDIGFDFWYLGSRYTQFSANVNGIIDLADWNTESGASGGSYDGYNEKFFYQSLTIAPMYDNLAVSSLSNIKYEVSGSFPSRVLTVEWSGADFSGDTSPNLNFQVKLYEGSGVIEFVYGTMTAGSASYSYATGIHDYDADGTPTADEALVQQTANTATFSNGVVFNLSTVPASNSKIELTPPVAASPTNLTFTSVKWNKMTLNWDDNASNELHYAIYRSDDGGSTFSFIDSLDPGTTSFTNYNLSINTSYQWRVCAITDGGLAFSVAATQGTNSGLLTGTYTVGPSGTYTTLTDAIAAIRTEGVIGATVFELQSDYTSSGETYPINLLDSNWTSPAKTITIRPAAGATGLSISSNDATATIRFNKANYFTLDGRPGGVGSSKELTLENTSTSGFAVEFINAATHNTLQYCDVKGVNTNQSAGGVIGFVVSAVDDYGNSNAIGNQNNVVTSCDIHDGASTPANGVVIAGLNSLPDSNNTISYNNIYNYFTPSNNFTNGVSVAGFVKNPNIIGNSFYQTASRTAAASLTVTGVLVNGSGNTSVNIQGNSIGGSTASAGGSPWTVGPTSQSVDFLAIEINSSSAVCHIDSNTVRNIALSTGSTDGPAFAGVMIFGVDTAYVIGNTVGSDTGTSSITMTSSQNNGLKAIDSWSGSNTIMNNKIGSITTSNTSTGVRTYIFGIGISSTTELATISGNTIGSTVTPNSISQSSSNTASFQPVAGIYYTPNGSVNITNNTIAHINSNYAGTSTLGQVYGISVGGYAGCSAAATVSNNSISAITTTSQNSASGLSASAIGISCYAGPGLIVSNNTVDSVVNTASSASVNVIGIYVNIYTTSGANKVGENKITNLLVSSSSTSSAITGIWNVAGKTQYQNNMVSIGDGLTTEYSAIGIKNTAASGNNSSFFFNTSRIGGLNVGTTATNTYSFYRASAATDSLKDNIFINNRSNASTGGKHYSIYISSTSGLTSDYNNLFVDGTGGVLGFSSSDRSTLSDWQSATSMDAHSVSTAVTFTSGTDLHLSGSSQTDATLDGTSIPGITTDYDGDTRNATTPMMGADEYVAPLPVELTSFTVQPKGTGSELAWTTATELNNYGFEVERRASLNPSKGGSWEKIGFVQGSGTTNSSKSYSFVDATARGKVAYRLKQIDRDGEFKYSQEVEVEAGSAPKVFSLTQNYPNPFNPTTTIGFTLQVSGMTTLKVYDAIGREVATLVNENLEAGTYHQATFNASNLASGIYFTRLQNNGKQMIKKMLLMK